MLNVGWIQMSEWPETSTAAVTAAVGVQYPPRRTPRIRLNVYKCKHRDLDFAQNKHNVGKGRGQEVDPGEETQLLQQNPGAMRRLDSVPTTSTSAETKQNNGSRLLICNSEP